MGFLDKALDKTKEVLSENADKVGQAIDKAGDIIDEKTQGKYTSTVDKVQDAAKNIVEKNRTDKGDQPTLTYGETLSISRRSTAARAGLAARLGPVAL